MKRRLAAVCCVLFALCLVLGGCDYGPYPYEFEGSRWRAAELDMYFEVDEKHYAVCNSNCFGFWERNGERIKISVSFGHGYVAIEPIPCPPSGAFFWANADYYATRFILDLTEDHTRRVQGDDIPLQLTFIRVDGTPRDHDKWFKSEPAVVLPDRREERA